MPLCEMSLHLFCLSQTTILEWGQGFNSQPTFQALLSLFILVKKDTLLLTMKPFLLLLTLLCLVQTGSLSGNAYLRLASNSLCSRGDLNRVSSLHSRTGVTGMYIAVIWSPNLCLAFLPSNLSLLNIPPCFSKRKISVQVTAISPCQPSLSTLV